MDFHGTRAKERNSNAQNFARYGELGLLVKLLMMLMLGAVGFSANAQLRPAWLDSPGNRYESQAAALAGQVRYLSTNYPRTDVYVFKTTYQYQSDLYFRFEPRVVSPTMGPWWYLTSTDRNPEDRSSSLQAKIDQAFQQSIAGYVPPAGCPQPVNLGINAFHPNGVVNPDFTLVADGAIGLYDIVNGVCQQRTQDRAYLIAKVRDLMCSDSDYSPDNTAPPYACNYRGPDHVDIRRERRVCDESCEGNVANPINVLFAEKREHEADIQLPWISFKRNYYSMNGVKTSLGVGWFHNFSSKLDNGTTPLQYDSGESEYQLYEKTFNNYTGINNLDIWLAKQNDGTWRLDGPNGLIELFDTQGRLTRRTSASGDFLLSWNASNQLSQICSATQNRCLDLQYLDGYLKSISTNGSVLVTYSYDAIGNLTKVTYPDSTSKTYKYDNVTYKNYLTSIIDENQLIYASFEYDTMGRAAMSQHAGGVDRAEVTYTVDGASVLFPTGKTGAYKYSMAGGGPKLNELKTSTSQGAVLTDSWTRSLAGVLLSRFEPNGKETRYTRINGWRIQKKSDYISNTLVRGTEYIYNAAAKGPLVDKTKMFGSNGVAFKEYGYLYNSRNQVTYVSETDLVAALTRTTIYSYCEQADITAGTCPLLGLMKSVDGPRTDITDVTTYTYRMADEATCATAPTTCPYRKGDLWQVTNALNQITYTLKYDGAGRPLSMQDANGVITDYTYHPRGWLTARKVRGTNDTVETDDQITTIEYWPTGLVKKVTQPDGDFTAYTYDAAHRLTDIADNANNTIHYTLDNAGNRTQEDTKDPSGTLLRTLSRVYNQLGQLGTAKDAYLRPTTFSYDANGNMDMVGDALSRTTDNDYDPLNRLSRTLQDLGGLNAETTFAYDAQDNLTKITDPKGLNTNYAYNGFNDLTTLTSPDTGTTTYTYDSGGNRATQIDARGITTAYTYDALNRLKTIAYSNGDPGVTYIYDLSSPKTACPALGMESFHIGRLAGITDASGTTLYCYDRFGQITLKKQVSNGVTRTVKYAYTLGGRLRSVTYPDGAVVDYVRDGQGRTTEVGVTRSGQARQVLLNQATYYPFGPASQWTYGNGRLLQRSLNQNYQPGFIQDAVAGGLSLGYQFDEVGNLLKLRNGAQTDPPKRLFGYDTLNRLTSTKDGSTNAVLQGYAYDKTGNRTSATVGATTTPYTYPASSHRLDSVGTTARTYDAVGNTLTIGGAAKSFVYNGANRMSQVKNGATVLMTYLYNGRGEQVRKYVGTTNTYTVYDEAGHWLGDYDNSGVPTQQAIWLDDLPVGLLVGASTTQKLHYLQPDALGTPRVVIDPTRGTQGTAIWNWDLQGEAFGTTAPNQDPDGDASQFIFNMRFPGQRYDAASGLNYNYFRDYDAATGRYVQSDPIGLKGGASTYGYVGASPLMWKDPSGLVRWEGTISYYQIGDVGSVGVFEAKLTSQCVNGRKATVTVRAGGGGLGIGLRRVPISANQTPLVLEDYLPDIYPENMNGIFFSVGVGFQAGGNGFSCGGMQFGSTWTPAVTPGPFSCDPPGNGIDIGAGMIIGSSRVLGRPKWSKCNECNAVVTPFERN